MTSLLASACVLVLATEPVAPEQRPSDESTTASPAEDEDAFARARRLHQQERYDEAAVAYAEAWVSQPAPDILYDWAQVERLSGHCTEAVELYERFLAMNDGGRPPRQYVELYYPEDWARMVSRATEMRDQCRAELEAAATEVPAEPEPIVDEPPPEPANDEPANDEPPPPEPIADDARPTPWHRDRAGIVLSTMGASLLGVGAGLMITAEIHDARADDQPSHEDFVRRLDLAAAEQLAGIVALGVGGAVVLGGVIRFAVVARRPGSSRPRATGWVDPRGGGVGLVGRF